MDPEYTPHQKRYFAEQLTLTRPTGDIEALTSSMSGVRVDLNPHQVDAALFALESPLSNGTLLADEVGLGKTIEAGLVLAQYWAEQKKRILLILPASLRTQWKTELAEKFNIPSIIIERPKKRKGVDINADLFSQTVESRRVAICSYEYAASCQNRISAIPWDLVVIDEAHRLRNVYKPSNNKRAVQIRDALKGRKKLLLTATPLQNNIRELYGLSTIIDEHIFGDVGVFANTANKNPSELRERLSKFCKRTLRKDVADVGYVKFTQRQVITFEYEPRPKEQELYDRVSEYLRREHVRALPDNGRNLVAMVVRKLLASSSAAISKTLQSLINTLNALLEGYEDNLEKDLAENFDAYDEYTEEYLDDDANNANTFNNERLKDKDSIQAERKLLEGIKELAESITHDAKGDHLIKALDEGFKIVTDNKGSRKAVIFTESTRTQEYVLDLLNEGGYKGQVVLLNGSNKDNISKCIYAEWKERHKGDGSITGSRDADMKAAIVEEFRDRASILIGTEAAAEGINLQFCSLVVNYDLPWNPQRVEQRIGRCHRYGQKYDVVVINFVNIKNAADKRVYQLLKDKFHLFEGIFGSSDQVLGALESGVDFENEIFKIYQECRTETQINDAFNALEEKYKDVIQAKKEETRLRVLETFDEDVTAKLKNVGERTRTKLQKFDRWKYDLFIVNGAKQVSCDPWIFEYGGKQYIPSWETSKNTSGIFLSGDSPVYIDMLKNSLDVKSETCKIRFNHSSLPLSEHIAFLNDHPNLTGSVSVDKLTYTYGQDRQHESDKEEHLIVSAIDSNGIEINEDILNRMMEIPGTIVEGFTHNAKLDEIRRSNVEYQENKILELNKTSLVNRIIELDAWCEDKQSALSDEIDKMKEDLKLKKGRLKAEVSTLTIDEVKKLKDEISKLDRDIDSKQRKMLDNKDDIRKSSKKLQDEAEKKLDGVATLENILTFSFEIV